MTRDTNIGGASGRFPATHWSAVLAARSDDPAERSRALEAIAAAYWKPIYNYLRIRWGKSNEDAKDLTQDFFSKLVEKEYLGDFHPPQMSFNELSLWDNCPPRQNRLMISLRKSSSAVFLEWLLTSCAANARVAGSRFISAYSKF